MIIYPEKIINCIISGCNGFTVFHDEDFIDFIKETNNKELIKKYKISILFYDYFVDAFFFLNMENILKYYFFLLN